MMVNLHFTIQRLKNTVFNTKIKDDDLIITRIAITFKLRNGKNVWSEIPDVIFVFGPFRWNCFPAFSASSFAVCRPSTAKYINRKMFLSSWHDLLINHLIFLTNNHLYYLLIVVSTANPLCLGHTEPTTKQIFRSLHSKKLATTKAVLHKGSIQINSWFVTWGNNPL